MNVQPKNYDWPEFYDHLVDVTRYSFSWKAIGRRIGGDAGHDPEVDERGAGGVHRRVWAGSSITRRCGSGSTPTARCGRSSSGRRTRSRCSTGSRSGTDLGPLYEYLPDGRAGARSQCVPQLAGGGGAPDAGAVTAYLERRRRTQRRGPCPAWSPSLRSGVTPSITSWGDLPSGSAPCRPRLAPAAAAEFEVLFAHQTLAIREGGRGQVPQQELAADRGRRLPGARLEGGVKGRVLGPESGLPDGAFHGLRLRVEDPPRNCAGSGGWARGSARRRFSLLGFAAGGYFRALRRRSQVVRQRSAKPRFVGSIPTGASDGARPGARSFGGPFVLEPPSPIPAGSPNTGALE